MPDLQITKETGVALSVVVLLGYAGIRASSWGHGVLNAVRDVQHSVDLLRSEVSGFGKRADGIEADYMRRSEFAAYRRELAALNPDLKHPQ